ncbi:MAG: putative porin, partial [Prevotella sp.]|nr:putative porin [Prevotella sp.]
MLRITFLCIISAIAFLLPAQRASAQYDMLTSENGDRFSSGAAAAPRDTAAHKEIPRGITVWTVDELSGDRTPAVPDTMSYLRMNHLFASGIYGEYNTLGNNGTPRLLRIFTDRKRGSEFIFTNGYSQTMTEPGQFLFTNTYSPITNLDFNQCGNHTNGEDHLKATFAVNASRQLGFGFKFDYLYARGYYANQSTSHFNYTLWGSYLGDRYQAHLLLSTNHQKEAENGGITNDEYITHPESFEDNFMENEIPTV